MAISFENKGTQYTLEFTRDSVKQMERVGFSVSMAENMPVTAMQTLFKGAFIAHHPRISQATIDEIWDNLGNKDGLFDALLDLYNEPVEALMKEPEEGKKIEWKVV
ncbi:MAG: DUF5055 domain-containing protein [Clostridiales bacterium]|nr:DUF5055 domain-containing protein [Clostridiales bacterium]